MSDKPSQLLQDFFDRFVNAGRMLVDGGFMPPETVMASMVTACGYFAGLMFNAEGENPAADAAVRQFRIAYSLAQGQRDAGMMNMPTSEPDHEVRKNLEGLVKEASEKIASSARSDQPIRFSEVNSDAETSQPVVKAVRHLRRQLLMSCGEFASSLDASIPSELHPTIAVNSLLHSAGFVTGRVAGPAVDGNERRYAEGLITILEDAIHTGRQATIRETSGDHTSN